MCDGITAAKCGGAQVTAITHTCTIPVFTKMMYDWRDKERECYKLYVEEQRSLEEVMEWMKENKDFNPR